MAVQQALHLSWEFDGKQQTRDVEVGQTIIIGRQPGCDVVIADEKISRWHAQITGRLEGDRRLFELKNLSQTNSVFFRTPANLSPLAFDQVVMIPEDCQFLLGTVLVTAALPPTPQVKTGHVKQRMVRCANCRELVDASLKDCPWCGTTLAFGGTII